MSTKELISSIVVVGIIIFLPHANLFPLFTYSIPILLLVWLFLKRYNASFSDIGFSFKQFESKAIVVGSLVAVSSLALMQLAFFPVLETIVTWEYNDAGLNDFIRGNQTQLYFSILMAWLIGGFYEEMVFHGFIYTRLEKMIKGKYAPHVNFIITASIFGLYHVQLDTLGVINALVVGAVYLALFLYFKRNLWYAIICHGVYNTVVMVLIYHNYL